MYLTLDTLNSEATPISYDLQASFVFRFIHVFSWNLTVFTRTRQASFEGFLFDLFSFCFLSSEDYFWTIKCLAYLFYF